MFSPGSPRGWALVQLCPGCCSPASAFDGRPWARHAAPSLHICHSHGRSRGPADAQLCCRVLLRVLSPGFGFGHWFSSRGGNQTWPSAQGGAAVPQPTQVLSLTFLFSVSVLTLNGTCPSNNSALPAAEAQLSLESRAPKGLLPTPHLCLHVVRAPGSPTPSPCMCSEHQARLDFSLVCA